MSIRSSASIILSIKSALGRSLLFSFTTVSTFFSSCRIRSSLRFMVSLATNKARAMISSGVSSSLAIM